jgi:putative SOS response-associated peptidase YedK
MCGRFNLIDSPEVQRLCELLGVPLPASHLRADIAPGATIAIIHSEQGPEANERRLSEAVWWLLLDPTTGKPNTRYASFNSRSDKLNVPRAAAYAAFRETRCLIPASAFVEGLGDRKTYHKIELESSAIAFGGVYRRYVNKQTGETVLGASIITLPPLLPQWQNIHPKSLPLMIDYEDTQLVDKWLDPSFDCVEEFAPLLEPRLQKTMKVTRIDKPSKWNPIEDAFLIQA